MKKLSITLTLFVLVSFCYSLIAQVNKFRFDIDGQQFLSIRENPNGYIYMHQTNLQSSMFFGFNSGLNNIDDPMIFNSGKNNTAYGFETLSSNTTGLQNTAIGSGAMTDNISGFSNVGIGFGALKKGTTAFNNIGIGKSALLSNKIGNFNIAIGTDAFNSTKTASRSVAIGNAPGANDTTSIDNVYIGYAVGFGSIHTPALFDRSENTMIGSYAGFNNNTSGNVFLGHRAGYNSNADNQLYITNNETDSLSSLIYGQFDNELLRINGELNIDGHYSMPTTAPSTGDVLRATNDNGDLYWYNLDVSWEYGAGDDVVYEDGDVGVGIGNPIYRIDVQDNASNGYVARFRNTNTSSGSKGIIIQSGPITNPNTSTYYALLLDGNGTNIGGIRGDGSGGVMYSTTSDRRLKQNIETFENGLETIAKIEPTTYQMKSNPSQNEIGFIAQDLQKVLPQVVGGHPTDDLKESPMTVDYGRITPVLVAAIKEQQELIKKLTDRLDKQETLIDQIIQVASLNNSED